LSIGENIKKYRNLVGLTQKELGEKIGKTTSSIRKYEADKTEIPRSVLEKISEVLEVHIDYLLHATFEEWIASLPLDMQEYITTMNPEEYYRLEYNFNKNLVEYDGVVLESKELNIREKNLYKNYVKDIGEKLNSIIAYVQLSITLEDKVNLDSETLQELKRFILYKDMTKQDLIGNISDKDKEIILNLDKDVFDTLERIKKESNFKVDFLDEIQKHEELPEQAIDEINEFIDFIKHKYQDKE
jgi:transcriptional regulator with XRE-family HTH domain